MPPRRPAPNTSWTFSTSTASSPTRTFVITGEGRLDDHTLQGKLPAAVALRAAPKPTVVVGRNDLGAGTDGPFADVFAVADLTGSDTSHDPHHTAELLQQIGTRIGLRYATV